MPVAVVLQWFDEAASHDGTFQRGVDNGSQPVTGLDEFSESYRPVEDGVLQGRSERALLWPPVALKLALVDADHFFNVIH